MFIPIKTKDESPDANTVHTKETEVIVIAAVVTHLRKFELPYLTCSGIYKGRLLQIV